MFDDKQLCDAVYNIIIYYYGDIELNIGAHYKLINILQYYTRNHMQFSVQKRG